MKQNNIPFLVAILFVVFLIIPGPDTPALLGNSTKLLSIATNTTRTGINTPVIAAVQLNTPTAINAVGITIYFDPHILAISSVDTQSSFCTLYTDRTYDTHKGFVRLYCGKPNPGFTGTNTLETITFNTIGYGKSDIAISPKSLILKNDGRGTNVLNSFEKKTISVILSQ